jgi:Flp pilus assembly protein TadD
VLDLAGNVALMVGELETARRHFEDELKLTPSSSAACVGLGEVFYLADKDLAAKTMFEHAVANDDTNAAAKRGLAKVNIALGVAECHNSLNESPSENIHEEVDASLEEESVANS